MSACKHIGIAAALACPDCNRGAQQQAQSQSQLRALQAGDQVIGTVKSITPVDPARGDRIAFLEAARPELVDYLKMKLDAEDWHGCQDAASDLRDLDSELEGLRY